MQNDNFKNRLSKALTLNNISQTELSKRTKIDKSLISNYLKGKYKAGQDNLTILAKALDVSEPWLMGYDVPINENTNIVQKDKVDELEVLFMKYKDSLSEKDKEHIKFIIEQSKKESEN